MKTVFALLGLFMFASVSTTQVVANNNSLEPVLTNEASGQTANSGKKQMVILQ